MGQLAQKDLKKLSRLDLMELLVAQAKKIEQLEGRVAELEESLADRQILIEESGSIAEASLKLQEVFLAAQKAADQYLENIKRVK